MKKFSIFFVLGIFACTINGFSQIKVSSSGYVGINNTSPGYRLDVIGNVRMGSTGSRIVFNNGELGPYSTDYGQLGSHYKPWADIFGDYIECNDLVEFSDKSLKNDITDVTGVKKGILDVRPVRYKLNVPMPAREGETAERPYQFGFLAQEVQEIFPELVKTTESGKLGIRYLGFIPLLVQTLKEQQSEIDDLKARIEKLETAGK